MALTKMPDNSDCRNHIKQILSATARARELIKQILTFSRRDDHELKTIDIGRVVHEVVLFLHSTLPSTIEINNGVPEKYGKILADPTQIYQVIINLCTNSVQAMSETGIIEIRPEKKHFDENHPSNYSDLSPGIYIGFSVRDNGRGIDPDIMNRIFEPYFTTRSSSESSGMGLAIVHGIIKSHQGHIFFESEPDRGTSISILLPEIHYELIETEEIESVEPICGSGRILFVDDDVSYADAMKKTLELLGYDVDVKNSSGEALDEFRQNPDVYDIIISDQTMPKMTGLTLAVEIRKLRPDKPIILCTGYSETATSEIAKRQGISDLLMKPFSISQISNSIHRAINKNNQQ